MLALLGLKANDPWGKASAPLCGITEMMDYFRRHYGRKYAPNTRETVRRQTVHQFVQVGLVRANPDEPARPINSPNWRYQIAPDAIALIRTYGKDEWKDKLEIFLQKNAEALGRLSQKERRMTMIPVKLPDGRAFELTAGGQNILIKKIIEEFCPRFTPGGVVVSLGDAGEKLGLNGLAYLEGLGVHIDSHGKMPDVVIHILPKNWLVLIEAVTSHGPIDIKRHNELEELFKGSKPGLVFVTAFETRKVMSKFLSQISWETEVWTAESPSHLVHFNGQRFLGPYGQHESG
jgi:adenine-specific DNA-methyltransferase